jgi:enoyl-CoA hydratase
MIRSEIVDDIGVITIDRVEKANSLSDEAKRMLTSAIEDLVQGTEARAIVLTGEGQRSFCAGSDIFEMRGFDVSRMYDMLEAERSMYLAALRSPKPIVAAVNGYALGAGLALVLSCDYAVASKQARFGAPELRLGVPVALQGLLLPLVVGIGKSRGIFYTGRELDAVEAASLGLVHELTVPGQCLPRAMEMARQISRLPGSAFTIQKRLLYRLASSGHLDAVVEESHFVTSLLFAGSEPTKAIDQFLSDKAE